MMRKLKVLVYLLIAASCIINSDIAASNNSNIKVYAQSDANIRSGRSTENKIVNKVKRNEILYVNDLKSGWYAVYSQQTSNEIVGYIYSNLVGENKYIELNWNSNGYDWFKASIKERKRISGILKISLNNTDSYRYEPLSTNEVFEFFNDYYSIPASRKETLMYIYELAK